MTTFINDVKKLFLNIISLKDDTAAFSEKTVDSAIKTSRTIKCFKQTKNLSYYVSKFKDDGLDRREFIRLLIEIPAKNNLKSQNINTIIGLIRDFESYFIYSDKIKLYSGCDGLIYMDVYRENKFPPRILSKKESVK